MRGRLAAVTGKQEKTKSVAARVAAGDADPPKNVVAAIAAVEALLDRRHKLLRGELARGECDQERFDFESHPDQHYAYQWEEVDGEVVEIRKHGDGPTQIIHRPEMSAREDARAYAPGKV
jgi:hypothetical protein